MQNDEGVQAVFDNVMVAGFYANALKKGFGMGHALRNALEDGAILGTEFELAQTAIDQYLRGTVCAYLRTALREAGHPYSPDDLMHLYQNWADRPALLKGGCVCP